MSQEVRFRNPKSKFGKRHVPMRVLTWIRKAGFTKDEFFDLYPDYDYDKEGFPQVLVKMVQEKQQAQRNRRTVKQLEREVTLEIERRKLKCGCKAHTKDSKNSCKKHIQKVIQLPMFKRHKPILKVGE